MIRIYIGAFKQQGIPELSLQLRSPEEYPTIRLKLREAIHSGNNLNVYVFNRACDDWFWDLLDYPSVSIINEDPREQLKRKLNVFALPRELEEDPELIFDFGLLVLPEPSNVISDVWKWILQEKLGEVWTIDQPSFEHLAELVNWYLSVLIQSPSSVNPNDLISCSFHGKAHALFQEKVHTFIQNWTQKAEGNLRVVYKTFFEAPIRATIFLACWQNLSEKYPQQLNKWLEEENLSCSNLEWVSGKLDPIQLPTALIDNLSKKIEMHWNGRLYQELSLEKALSEMSGKIMGEFLALKQAIEAKIHTYNRFHLEMIRSVFKSLDQVEEELDKLEQKIPPSFPSFPDGSWKMSEWIQWAVKEYIPFKKWLIDYDHDQNSELAEKASKLAELYENWLYENYPSFIHDPECLVYGTFKQVSKLLEEDVRVIWILIDNLPVFWMPEVLEAFTRHNLILSSEPKYTLAILPSATFASRKAVLAGQIPNQIKLSEKEAFVKGWYHRGVHEVKIVEKVDQLPDAVSDPAKIYLLIYNQLDYIAHTPEYQLSNRQYRIKTELEYLTQQVEKAINVLNQIGKTYVFISTDHGSTKLPEKAEKVDLPTSAEVGQDFDRHHRFIRIKEINALNQHDWFVLSADSFGLSENYAIVRGKRYIDNKPRGYTHGGLSPEETVIPILIFKPGMIAKELSLSFKHISEPIRRGTVQRFKLAVNNPFSLTVTQLELFIPKFGIYTKITSIPASTRFETKDLEIRLPEKYPIKDSIAELDLTASYSIGGVKKHQISMVFISIRELYRTDIDGFGKIFNE